MAMAGAQDSDVAACSGAFENSIQKICTPKMKPQRGPFDSRALGNFSMCESSHKVVADDISTAAPSPWTEAPSPWMDSEFGSPWLSSPFPTAGKQRDHAHPGSIILPDLPPTLDFHALSGKLPLPKVCMIPSPLAGSASSEEKLNMTPRAKPRSRDMTPRATPRSKKEQPKSPPPRPAPKMSTLTQALQSKSAESVRQALLEDPCALTRSSTVDSGEPALCAAVRFECSSEIVELLLSFGADVHEANSNGQTPLRILRSRLKLLKFEVEVLGAKELAPSQDLLCVEELLLQAEGQAGAGVMGDEAAGDQDSDIGFNSGEWSKMYSVPPPMVDNMDLFEHLVQSAGFAGAGQTVRAY